ncbi:unnamed protein product, partial [Choristocarpus tenellus]
MPKLIPMGGRGPYAVGVVTEHFQTLPDDASVLTVGGGEEDSDPRPLELMAQVSF